jgi:HSP20 family protein
MAQDFLSEESNYEVQLTASKKPRNSGNEGHLTIDVYRTEDDIVIQSTIAGAKRDDIDINVTQDMVTIKGHREPEEPIKSSAYDHQELYWGPFSRAVILPEDIDPEGARADYKNGILTIHLPKLSKTRTKKIKIS